MDAQVEDRRSFGMTSGLVILVVGTMGAAYMVTQTLRNSIGVIAPDLAAELALSAAEIGLLSSAFFVAFAAAQVPLGVCLDRFGPKACMLACSGIAVVGALSFAVAATPPGLVCARALIGLGSSCYLMAPLAFYARRFPPSRFGLLTGIQLGLGTLGTIFATAPLAWSAATVGWRMTFVLIAAAMALAGVLLGLVVPGESAVSEVSEPRETLRESIAGTVRALRAPSVGALFLMHLTAYSTFVLIVGLWGGPYLTHIYGFGLQDRGDLLLITAVGQTVGLLIWGSLGRVFGGHKVPVLIGSALTVVALLLPAALGKLSAPALVIWLGAFGVISAYTALLVAHGKTLFPPAIVGRGMTLLNIGTMAGVFLSQAITGAVIDLFAAPGGGAYPLEAYRIVFAMQALWLAATMIPYLWARDPQATSIR
jgi:predicted MFS family arabinose efflux permease